MPSDVKRAVVNKINFTRKDAVRGKWKPTAESCICNLHYLNFKGPTRSNSHLLPQYFKRPHESTVTPAKRRMLVRNHADTSSFQVDEIASNSTDSVIEDISDQEDSHVLKAQNVELEAKIRQLESSLAQSKGEVEHLQTSLQRLDPSFLSQSQLHMYTSLGQAEFRCLVTWLSTTSVSRRSTSPCPTLLSSAESALTFSQTLLLVLMRIRQNLTQGDLACRFCIDQSSVSRILNQWIPMLANVLGGLIVWPQTNIGPATPPYNFLPNSVAIIDGTEIFIQRPSNLTTQKSSYSDYKSHTTVKYLVAIDTFTGVLIYVSNGFSGNASDRYTIEQSGILEVLKPGQRILADKGYTARDLFAMKRCFLTIPSFLSGNKFSEREALQSRTIASVRIRVENAIRRLKEFKIFTDCLSNRINKRIVDDMIVTACALCNLKERLINV